MSSTFPPLTTPPPKANILVVATLTTSKIIQVALGRQGMEVIAYQRAEDVSRNLSAIGSPKVAFIDLVLPGADDFTKIDGFKFIRALRANSQFEKTVFVIVVDEQKDTVINQTRARLDRVREYLTKPFTKEQIVVLAQKYVPGSRP
jgi:CheY-like chemotaxis protein